MTTKEIIEKINSLNIDSEESENFELISELTDDLKKNSDGQLACESLIKLLERHPSIEFGSPGEPVHTLEHYLGYYEKFLFASVDRQPTQMTVWMLNRIINGESDNKKKKQLLSQLKKCSTHPLADEIARETATEFLDYQND